MESEENLIHRRLVAGTQPLLDELKELGFTEQKPIGHGTNQIRVFKKDNKWVHSSYKELKMFVTDVLGTEAILHQAITVHDEMLKFFSTRDPLKIDEK